MEVDGVEEMLLLEDHPPGACPLGVDLLHEEIMAVMTIVEVHRLVNLHQIVMDGVVVVIGLLLVEAHLRDVVLHVEEDVMMDLLTGAEIDLPLEMTLLLVNLV